MKKGTVFKVTDETRLARRKQTQEIFTPDSVIDIMLDRLDPDDFTHLDKTWLDNSCGNGNILVRIIRRRFSARPERPSDAEILEIFRTTYGTDLMEDNVRECRQRLFALAWNELGYRGDAPTLEAVIRHNIVCTDMFRWNYEAWAPMRERSLL